MGGFAQGPPGQAQPGLPFGGIPPELQSGVDLLLAEEPDRGESEVTFSQQPSAGGAAPAQPGRAPHGCTPTCWPGPWCW